MVILERRRGLGNYCNQRIETVMSRQTTTYCNIEMRPLGSRFHPVSRELGLEIDASGRLLHTTYLRVHSSTLTHPETSF